MCVCVDKGGYSQFAREPVWAVIWNNIWEKSWYLIGWRTWAKLDRRWLCRGWPIYKALKIVFGKLITQNAVQDHRGACQKCRIVGPTPDLLNSNLQFNKIPRWLVSTLTFGKHWFRRQDAKQARWIASHGPSVSHSNFHSQAALVTAKQIFHECREALPHFVPFFISWVVPAVRNLRFSLKILFKFCFQKASPDLRAK